MTETYRLAEEGGSLVLTRTGGTIKLSEPASFVPSPSIRIPLQREEFEVLLHRANTQPDLLAALEAIARAPLTDDPEASLKDCLAEVVRIAEAGIAKARPETKE